MTTNDELTQRERHAGRHALGWIGTAIVGSLVVAALIMQSSTMFWIALLVGIPIILLLTVPVLLAVIFGNERERDKG